jgi:hypothetical protein
MSPLPKMKRAPLLIFALIALLGFAVSSRAQTPQNPSTYVQWGLAGASSSNGLLDPTQIPTTSSTNGVRYSNVNGMGYDIVVITKGLAEDGLGALPWNLEAAWWYDAAAASKQGNSIPYSTVEFRFYQQGTLIPFGLTGVNFTFQNAKVGERYRFFSYLDTVGAQVALSFTNYSIFSYSSGAPNIHLSDSSIDSGIPYSPGNIEGDSIGVDLSPNAISGFTFQTGRVDSNYGSNFLTALGYLVPTGQLLIQSGSNVNMSAGPSFVSTGNNAVLTPATLTGTLSASNAAVLTGNAISQNIVINEDILSGSGNSLTMSASQYILSATSEVSLSATSGNAGSLSLAAVIQSVLTTHLETSATSGASGSITISAGNNIGITSGIDSSEVSASGQGGAITLQAGNTITVDTIRSGGGGGSSNSGAPGNITLTATNSINIGAIYDDSGSGSNQAILTAPSIAIGQFGANVSDIAGALYLQHPMSTSGATISIGDAITGIGGLVIDPGSGVASLYSDVAYSGETDILSGVFAPQGNSLADSDLVLDNAGALTPGVTTPGGFVEVNSLTVGTNATVNIMLSSTSKYDQVQADTAANLDGIFNLTLADGFTPAIGQVFHILNFAYVTGDFGTYQGTRLANCVLQPLFTDTDMYLVASAIPTGASQPLQSVPPAGLNVSAGGGYDGLTSTLQTANGFTAAATLLDGTASQDTTVIMTLAAAGIANFQLQGSLGVTLLNLLGTGTDKVVVQLDYSEADALSTAGDERQLFLASSVGGAPFANAVLANTDLPDEANNPTEIFGPYDPTADFQLGYYGVDTVNNRVWAVVDYDAFFGLGAMDVSPSPASPSAATQPAANIMPFSATLNGLVNFNGFPTTVLFEFGTNPALAGSTVTPVAASGNTPGFVPVSYPATGITPSDTTNYFRIDAVTTSGTEYGDILSFTTPLSGINYWRNTYFGTYTNTGNASDTADPTADGIDNLLKYATGISPLVASSTPPALLGQTGSGSATYLTLTFNEIADPILTYSVQAANDLSGTWTTIWSSTGAGNIAGSVTVQDTLPTSAQPSRFLRLQVSY